MASTITKVSLPQVVLSEGFWASRQRLMTDVTIPYMESCMIVSDKQMRKTKVNCPTGVSTLKCGRQTTLSLRSLVPIVN